MNDHANPGLKGLSSQQVNAEPSGFEQLHAAVPEQSLKSLASFKFVILRLCSGGMSLSIVGICSGLSTENT